MDLLLSVDFPAQRGAEGEEVIHLADDEEAYGQSEYGDWSDEDWWPP